mmetsp:Transcript_11634/g.17800  ORF Transcript_11634/g.17800 Transcript_11634/m.17800 type:complete len:388 (+) Transcript_11634:92-1255(+)|eukprot:CAMPEP_0201716382 /NCGR_PEP_ID=MMETSP0593-20130828/2369_1 /ASSEMBLY_ACC=CAM_ASM_000672 /TAXON_ID=267983 /ORGANISM="Skeletonema japonicum, Strain CCMP2506" /LENGTH=387 /DNA_ID=CAMNT_0048206173 /DNA_START=5 /DNA_END=1168 /DNA_ORIENTATION=+
MAQQSSTFWVVTFTAIIVAICQLLIVYNQFQNNPPQIISDRPILSSSIDNDRHTSSNDAASTLSDNIDDELPDDYPYGLVIPKTAAVALPSVRISAEEDAQVDRKFYGGAGDKPHLGGFTSFDPMGVSPTLWKHMVEHIGMKSLLDVGCGIGISTSWFVLHGLDYVHCVEGSHDAVEKSLLPGLKQTGHVPNNTIYGLTEHDFSRGPWWPERTVDVAWCVEFSEHVGRNFQLNYFTSFRKAALIFMTHSHWGGWHHVEVHRNEWWVERMEMMGFVYSNTLTEMMHKQAKLDVNRKDLVDDMTTREKSTYHVGQHLSYTLQVFINPMVASLPQHAHLMTELGCIGKGRAKVECGSQGTTALPSHFKALNLTDEMDANWHDLIKDLKLA